MGLIGPVDVEELEAGPLRWGPAGRRLDHGGNRQLNCALHRIAITQARVHPPAPAYLKRRKPKAKATAKPSAASNANSRAPSTRRSRTCRY